MNSSTHVLIFLIYFSFITHIAFSSSKNSVSDSPVSYLLACGASSPANDFDGRHWIPDTKFLSSSKNSIATTAKSQDPALPSTVPYMNARIFETQSTYTFPVSSQERHWIRLHFYPSTFNNFNSSNAYFSVTAQNFTLLSNFSAYITALALTQAYIVREFSITPIQSGSLNLTFKPSKNGSFAFVNGIEIISMPDVFNSTSQVVGISGHSIDAEQSVLQTMVRLNVGGQYITPGNDSGLSRTWYDDTPYLSGAALGVTSEAARNASISYPTDLPKYIAPLNVYRTARTMGPSPDVNKNFNISWAFRVDANFTYLVRLHFCDYQLVKINQRVFDIFVSNQEAFPSADVIAWTGKQGVPMYKDFAIYVRDRNGDEELSVALRPNLTSAPEFNDAILNGMEIFKINDKNGNLAGPNPVPSLMPPVAVTKRKRPYATSKGSHHHAQTIGVVLGGITGFCLIAGAIVFIMRMRVCGERSNAAGWLPIYGSPRSWKTRSNMSRKSSCSSVLSTLGGGFCRHFTLTEIRLGTDNFDESRVIGVGGFGKVYKGIIDGKTEVAIKRAIPSSEQGVHEFQTEIDLLSKLRHRHLVSLIGACEESEEMILVYDYMANGTLREHLYKTNSPPLSWKKRLDICIGAARGLHYLHTGAKYTIIHRDVKTTNILLDEKWVAKVSDFGLSKTGPSLDQTHVSTMVKGSFGYLDPEYFRRQQLTEKSDVYSFGVVLLEVLCGRPALNASLPMEQVSLADWALICHEKGSLEEIVDPNIKEEINRECLKNFIDTTVKSLRDVGVDRPSMGTVLWNLEFARQLQNNPDGPKVVAEQKANDAYVRHAALLSINEDESEINEESGEQSKRQPSHN